MKKLLFMYNPVAGKGDTEKSLSSVVKAYSELDYLVTVYPTKEKGDGRRILGKINLDYDLVVVSGGDGTLSEIATTLATIKPELPVAFLPSGSTNDYARSLSIPKRKLDAVSFSAQNNAKRIDLPAINNESFLYVAAFGTLTDVTYTTKQWKKNSIGYSAYILEGAKEIWPVKFHRLKVSKGQNSLEGDFIAGLITNSFYVGGRRNMVRKDANLSDGIVEVVLIKKPMQLSGYLEIVSSLLKSEINVDYMLTFHTDNLTIESDDEIVWNLDGDRGGAYRKSTLSIKERALNIIAK